MKPKRGDSVSVRTPRGTVKTGKFQRTVNGPKGLWYEIKPHEKGAVAFKARPSMLLTVS